MLFYGKIVVGILAYIWFSDKKLSRSICDVERQPQWHWCNM